MSALQNFSKNPSNKDSSFLCSRKGTEREIKVYVGLLMYAIFPLRNSASFYVQRLPYYNGRYVMYVNTYTVPDSEIHIKFIQLQLRLYTFICIRHLHSCQMLPHSLYGMPPY